MTRSFTFYRRRRQSYSHSPLTRRTNAKTQSYVNKSGGWSENRRGYITWHPCDFHSSCIPPPPPWYFCFRHNRILRRSLHCGFIFLVTRINRHPQYLLTLNHVPAFFLFIFFSPYFLYFLSFLWLCYFFKTFNSRSCIVLSVYFLLFLSFYLILIFFLFFCLFSLYLFLFFLFSFSF